MPPVVYTAPPLRPKLQHGVSIASQQNFHFSPARPLSRFANITTAGRLSLPSLPSFSRVSKYVTFFSACHWPFLLLASSSAAIFHHDKIVAGGSGGSLARSGKRRLSLSLSLSLSPSLFDSEKEDSFKFACIFEQVNIGHSTVYVHSTSFWKLKRD